MKAVKAATDSPGPDFESDWLRRAQIRSVGLSRNVSFRSLHSLASCFHSPICRYEFHHPVPEVGLGKHGATERSSRAEAQHAAIGYSLGYQREEFFMLRGPEEISEIRIHDALRPALDLFPHFAQSILC